MTKRFSFHEPWTMTAEFLEFRKRQGDPMPCALCGERLKAGDLVRTFMTNTRECPDEIGGNPTMCLPCAETDNPLEVLAERVRECMKPDMRWAAATAFRLLADRGEIENPWD